MAPSRLLPFIVLAAAGACATPGAPPVAAAPAPAGPAAGPELEALYRARLDSAQRRFTPADVAFVTGMIGHHAQALLMARWAAPNDASPSVRTLAARITNAQQDEIALMQAWLRDRGQPVPMVLLTDSTVTTAVAGAPHVGHAGHRGHADHAMMPGMLTTAQLATLRAARGRAFDRHFLSLMIAHHSGAVTMVDDLFRTDGAGQDEAVFKLASDIQVDQRTEIARMELMLKALDGTP
jgi:uncharacterized protein (DUF305 family)